MEHGYGGHPYGAGPPQQFAPPPPLHGVPQQFVQGPAPPAFFPGPPTAMAGFPPYPQIPYHPPTGASFAPPVTAINPQVAAPLGFFNPWDPPPPIVPPPADPELQKRIEKLVEYAVKNGPEFEKILKEKQKDNPLYAFLFGAEGFSYYRYKLWITSNPNVGGPFMNPPPLAALPGANPNFNPAITSMNPNVVSSLNPALNTSMHSGVPPFYEQPPPQHHQPPYFEPAYPDSVPKTFKGLAGPLPADVAMELHSVLDNLTGTKESIKGAKNWFMQRLPFAPALAEALRERVLSLDDDIRQLHVIYLANDILFDSLQRRMNLKELDNEALAFQPVLGPMLAAIYHNPKNKEANQTRLQKILQFWGSKEVYGKEIISALENEMMVGPPVGLRGSTLLATSQMDKLLGIPANVTAVSIPEHASNNEHTQRLSPEKSQRFHSPSGKEENLSAIAALGAAAVPYGPMATQQVALDSIPPAYPASNSSFVSNLPSSTPALSQSMTIQLPTAAATTPAGGRASDLPPYPLFPPGLIPGMVRKMQIGTGVPYSPLSPLDIPAVIPPSTVSDSYILNRVSKFFKDIGEVDPLRDQAGSSMDDDEREDRERGRKGGACVPPPSNLNVDPETNTLPDGSMEHKPGSISTGRLGLGAVADPNEITQYDDVYTSYRKQRSTSYHTFMSARAAAR